MKLRYPCPTRGTATGLLNWGLIHVSASIRACSNHEFHEVGSWKRRARIQLLGRSRKLAIHCAMRNELVCSPRIAALLFSRVAAIGSERSHASDNSALTRREHEIVSLMTQGLSNKEIARQLRIQNATVKNHIHSILAKLHVRRRGEVAARMHGSALLSRGVPSPQHRHLIGSPLD
jgi:DNA-binding CsgD family transcriptional regulator